jgi:SAM-dependent methyltransferase
MDLPGGIDARSWLARWDQQQELYMPFRERRFRAMFDLLGVLLPPRFLAIDLAAGPGSLTERLLTRFPEARSVLVDYDPVLLAIGRSALAPLEARTRWVEADLREPGWSAKLPGAPADAVVSTTALHCFHRQALGRIYEDIAARLRPGGVFLNGDHLAFAPDQPILSKAVHDLYERDLAEARARPHAEDWDRWWARIRSQAALAPLVAERDRRFPEEHGAEPKLPLKEHAALLRAAGFTEIAVVWQEGDNRVLAAIR